MYAVIIILGVVEWIARFRTFIHRNENTDQTTTRVEVKITHGDLYKSHQCSLQTNHTTGDSIFEKAGEQHTAGIGIATKGSSIRCEIAIRSEKGVNWEKS